MLESVIRNSQWWERAARAHDRHYAESEDVSVADHLLAVAGNVRRTLIERSEKRYEADLQNALTAQGVDIDVAFAVLHTVALLHDIGKPIEDKTGEAVHPISGKLKPARHPLLGACAAVEILPDEAPNRNTIIALVEEHDTPYSWYRQFEKNGSVPSEKAWAKLGRKIWPDDDSVGIILLALFKLADIDGHQDLADVVWFFEQANASILRKRGRWLPVPTTDYLEPEL